MVPVMEFAGHEDRNENSGYQRQDRILRLYP